MSLIDKLVDATDWYIDQTQKYVAAGKEKIHNYMELRRARKIVRQWGAMPDRLTYGGFSYQNPAKIVMPTMYVMLC